ncbi:phosphocholine-specific phospholipase C [Streptomyces sp. NPDC014861]|uniref:phosphocholine-specific phospholipase C n=1 Tax=Streptomyces sp. NPDC014861 TaxID=3364923 RepID=UPI0036FD4071
MPDFSRRKVLGTLAAGSALSVLPPSLLTAMAAPMPRGGLRAVEHVIVLMQENRSFDNYFGTLRGVRGFGDRGALRLPDGAGVFEQPRAGGPAVLPFSARQAAVDAGRPEGDIQYLGSLPHGFADGVQARANGWWNDWIAAKGQSTMAHYDRRDIPLQYELADRFTICDAYHCSVFGSTNPNRNYLWTGTTGFEPGGGSRAVTNAAYSYGHAGYDWTTYPERLEAAGVSWQIYQEWDNFTDNAVEYFKPWKRIGRKILTSAGFAQATTEEFYDKLWAKSEGERRADLARFRTAVDALPEDERRLFLRGAYRSEPGTLVTRIKADIKAGTLPRISWVVPTAALSEHPGSSTPAGSAGLVYDLLDAIASDPRTWSKTALFINFDENDGYFDHVPAPTAPRPDTGDGDDWVGGRPVGPGPRVPMTVVSPWTVGGFVNSELFDHTSVIRFLEKWTGVQEPNISAWRRSVFGDLTSVFDFDRAYRQPEVERPGAVPAPIGRWNPVPPAAQKRPRQEPGVRPTRPSPYRLSLRATVTDTEVRLGLGNDGRRTAVFTAYPGDGTAPRVWTVAGRDSAAGSLPYGPEGYDLQVHGPGSALWELRGAGAGAEARVVERGHARRVDVECGNQSARTRTLLVGESTHPRRGEEGVRRVRLAPGRRTTVSVPLARHGWYDIVVLDEDDPCFLRRMSGRAEDGRPGGTDPAIGTGPALTAALSLPAPLPPLTAPLVQGSPAEVVVRVSNEEPGRLRDLSVALTAPAGWTVEPAGPRPRSLPGGGAADLRFTVTPAADATAATLTVVARGEGDGLLRVAEARVRADVARAVSLTLTAPASSPGTDGCAAYPDTPLPVTATVTNAGSVPLTALSAALAVPDGWRAEAAAGTPVSVPARTSVKVVWRVTAPPAAARTSVTLKATVGGRAHGGAAVERTASLDTRVGPVMTGHLLAENFESLADRLAPATDLSRPGLKGWTRTAPEGWTVTNAAGMPQGTEELNGWTFLSRQFWFPAGQERGAFARSLGIVAVADPDDWDDKGSPSSRGTFDSTLTTPPVEIPAGTPTLHLGFDSHYRQESPQEAEVTVVYDTGATSRVLHYSSAASGNTNAGRDQQNRLVTCSFPVPADARSVKVGFRVHHAGNNWFWAVDNIRLSTSPITDA